MMRRVPTPPAERQIITLDAGWKFTRENTGLNAATGHWDAITIPHTWNANENLQKGGNAKDENQNPTGHLHEVDPGTRDGYYRGACWYARELEVPADWKGAKRVFLRFEAASLIARVYINKMLLGEHRGAFTAFCFELTPYLRLGAANEIRVQVDNSISRDLAPLSGDFDQWGGIYRPVQCIVTDEVCISPLHFASSGVYLTIKSLDQKEAQLEVKTLVSNGARPVKPYFEHAPAHIGLETTVTDAEGNIIAKILDEQAVPADATITVTQELRLADPRRWHGRKDPHLYHATVRIILDGRAIDAVTQSFGLRTVAITTAEGFLLNGQPYPILGVNRHQDFQDKGWATDPGDEEVDIEIIAEMGATAIRNAHYPQSASWHDLADRLGFLLWDEVPLVNETSSSRAFWLNAEEQMREMVHQLYNHPSVAWWGIFNELENLPTPPSGPELERLRDGAKEIDPGRIVVGASDHGHRYYNRIPDQIGFNNYPGWYKGNWPADETYRGDLEQMSTFIEDRAREAGQRIAITEYGAGSDAQQHAEGPPVKPEPAQGGPFQPEEYQTWVHERTWAQMKDNPRLWGVFIWQIFDSTAANRNEGGTPGINTKGIVTRDRQIKKDAYFFYKANWNTMPTVAIASRRLVQRSHPATEVKVFSNAAKVELVVNGSSFGRKHPDAVNVARWPDVPLQLGKNQIEAIGLFDSGTIIDTCDWTLNPMG